jgi:hypothetical protein
MELDKEESRGEAKAMATFHKESDEDSDEDNSDNDQVGHSASWKPSDAAQKQSLQVFTNVLDLSPRVAQSVCRQGLYKKEYLSKFDLNRFATYA